MNMLFAHHTADLYGASRSLLRLTSRLRADGHNVIAVIPGDGPLRAELERAGVLTVILPSLAFGDRKTLALLAMPRLLWQMAFSTLQLLRLIRAHAVDLVHTNTAVTMSPAIAAYLSGRPHVWHIREFFLEFPALWRIHRRFMYRFADAIVAISSAVATQFEGYAGICKVRVIHNGLPKEEFEGVTADRTNAFRTRFGLNGGPAVGLVGRIKLQRKGQDVLVRAVALLADRFPEARFLLIGSPFPGNENHLAKLERMIQELNLEGHVIYTGDVGDIKAAYSALDFTVLPTALPEPLGGVVTESMAMGKPVIASRFGGAVELIEDGVTGLLVEPGDPSDLAEAMAKLLSDTRLRSEMGMRAREAYMQRFEFEPFYQKVTQLYSELVP